MSSSFNPKASRKKRSFNPIREDALVLFCWSISNASLHWSLAGTLAINLQCCRQIL